MTLGPALILVAFGSAAAIALLHLPTLKGRAPLRGADLMLGVHAASLLAAMALLAEAFVSHRFQYEYVAQYSSRALSPALTLAASWAGQEGSILLWAFLGGLLLLAMRRQPGSLMRPALAVVAAAQIGLIVLLIVRSPFRLLPFVPADGQGLNPLLNDPWMVIHPPVLFVGYAGLLAPFALAVAAMIRRDYDAWVRMVWPWSLFGALAMGAGIALGGAWAYKVLGWGGYWGWDPVENASLVPWLVSIALLHGLMIQRATGALTRTNLLMAVLCWVTVLGGTYLTRSGILADFSVHSFADSGLNTPLTAFLAGSFFLGAGLLAKEWRRIPASDANWMRVNRASALWVGLVTVLVLAGLVTLGTTAPLITTLAGKPGNVDISFYEKVILPLGFLILLFMAIAPALRWSRSEKLGWFSAFLPGLVGGFVVYALALAAGVRDIAVQGLAAATGLAIGMNFWMMIRLFARGWRYGSGYLGHFGVAVMALGMMISGTLGKHERVRIPEGGSVVALGRTIHFDGIAAGPMNSQEMRIRIEKGGDTYEARPRLMPAPRGEGMIHTPSISMRRELYLSPLELQEVEAKSAGVVWLEKGKPHEAGPVTYTFTGFRMEAKDGLRVYADMDITQSGRTVKASPYVQAGPQGSQGAPTDVPGLGKLALVGMDADHGRVALHLPGMTGGATERYALVEFSTKPLINLVWIGAVLTLVGTALAGMRRAAQGGSNEPAAAHPRTAQSGPVPKPASARRPS